MDKELIGKQFNYLFVDSIERHDGRNYYKCICKCGNTVYTTKNRLMSGRIKSCGCKKHEAIEKYRSMITNKYNKWTVIDITKKGKVPYALCECECGNIREVNVYNILNNTSKDCGCGRKQALKDIKTKDLTGTKFGKLIPISRIGSDKNKRATYLCKCDCGNEIVVPSNLLLNHHTSSCGCLLSYYNSQIELYLKELNVVYQREYTVKINNKNLRFDFWLPNYNLFIEYDGEQHYMPVNFGHDNQLKILDDYKRTQLYDLYKNNYCRENNINLLRIPYTEKQNIKTIIYNHLQRLSRRDA